MAPFYDAYARFCIYNVLWTVTQRLIPVHNITA